MKFFESLFAGNFNDNPDYVNYPLSKANGLPASQTS